MSSAWQARFQTEEYVSSHLGKTINEVVVNYTPTAKIKRPKPDHTYDSMPGMKKTFLFMPIRTGVTLQRDYACPCFEGPPLVTTTVHASSANIAPASALQE